MNTKPKSFDVSKIVIDSNFPSREKNKISDKDEEVRNKKTLSILKKVDVVLLLIDSTYS